MGIVAEPALKPMLEDPDDYCPNSRWALVVDPGGPAGRVDSCLIFEEVAVGDRVPLHTHPMDGLVLVLEGTGEVTLGDRKYTATAGSTVFIPAQIVHGHRNIGAMPLKIRAVFPGAKIEIKMSSATRLQAPRTSHRRTWSTTLAPASFGRSEGSQASRLGWKANRGR